MSFISPIPRPQPERSPCMLMLEELADIWSVMETLSLRLAALEARSLDDRPQIRPETPGNPPPGAGHDSGASE